MQRLVSCMILLVIFCGLPLRAFTDEQLAMYERQSYELLYCDGAVNTVNDGDVERMREGFSDFALAVLDEHQLRVLRNMYFAQYGYRFTSSDLREWFGQFDWYEPALDNVNHKLTMLDSMMIDRIRHFESAYIMNRDIAVLVDDLVGIWHTSPVVAAGYNSLLYFYPDGRFEYAPNQMDWSQRLQGMFGTWHLDHNRLTLLIDSKGALLGGEIVEPTGSCASEFAIEGGHNETITFDPPEKMTFPISNISSEEYKPYPQADMDRMDIGSGTWWKLSIDPYQDLR